jgi:hypothetical protein
MITKEQIMELPLGYELHHRWARNADGTPERWRINGKVQTWKTRPEDFKVPVKYGLYSYGYITHNEVHHFCLTAEEVKEQEKQEAIRTLANMSVWSRKPRTFEEIGSHIEWNPNEKFLQVLAVHNCKSLWGLDNDPKYILMPSFVANPVDQVFLYITKDRKYFLVDTERYSYARYWSRVVNSVGDQ